MSIEKVDIGQLEDRVTKLEIRTAVINVKLNAVLGGIALVLTATVSIAVKLFIH